MGQVSLYIDDDVLKKAKEMSKRENISLSKFISLKLKEAIENYRPKDYEKLFGSVPDFEFIEPLDEKDDIPREKL